MRETRRDTSRWRCRNCGERLSSGARFCPNCGAGVERDEAQGPPSPEIRQEVRIEGDTGGFSKGVGQGCGCGIGVVLGILAALILLVAVCTVSVM